MQALARDGLTAAQVTSVLSAESIEVSGGCELLNPDLTVAEDISDDLVSGQVDYALYADIHRTCTVQLTRALAWGVDLIRPYTVVSDGATEVRFNTGVFALTTPQRPVGLLPETYDVQGYDRLYLLFRQVGDTYTVDAGVEYLTAIRDAITEAGLTGILLDGSATGVLLPRSMTWPLLGQDGNSPTTWLRIVNDLLSAINYRGVYADENGLFRSGPYVEPAARPVEFTFDADSPRTVVGEDRTLTEDVWNRPNRWTFVRTNMPGEPPAVPVEGDGIFIVAPPLTAGELVRHSVVTYEASSQDSLVGLGNRRVAADLRVTSTLELTTAPFPAAGHADIYRLRDVAVGDERTVQATRWTQDLTGGDTTWNWERVG